MNIKELIDKHAWNVGSEEPKSYKRFAIELLEMVKENAQNTDISLIVKASNALSELEARAKSIAIDKALEELKK